MIDGEYDALWMRPKWVPLTGENRTLAIIDQPLWKGHPAYSENFDKIIGSPVEGNSMHGAAVASIAVGEIGVAQNAKLIYCEIETWRGREMLLKNHAQALRDLQVYVKSGNHIDAVSTSHGWMQNENGAADNDELISWFEDKNIPVFSANERFVYVCGNQGAADFLQEKFDFDPICKDDQVAIPIDNRLIAHKCQNDIDISGGKLYYRMQKGGMSWAVPFVAGLFTLAREAKPTMSRQDFLQTLLATTRTVYFGDGYHLPVANIKGFCEEIASNCVLKQGVETSNFESICTRPNLPVITSENRLNI